MGVKIASVATAIAGLSVSGVSLKDISAIPEQVDQRQCPILFPDPAGFVTGLSISRETLGLDSVAGKNVNYTLNYIYLHCEVGTVRYLTDAIDTMVDKTVLVLNAIADNSTVNGAVDLVPNMAGEFGQIEGPSGNTFFGCKILIAVQEFYEVT